MKKALKTLLAIILFLSVVAAVVPCKTITQEEPSASESPSVHVLTHSYEEHSTDSTFHIHYIDVGQADAALVECDGHYMLIDGGNQSDSDKIYSILKQKEIKHLDIVIGTHAHEDHIGGLPGALNYAKADVILCPVAEYDSEAFRDFVTYANKNGPGICIPSAGAEYKLGSASIKILGVNSGSDTNDTSIVLKICYGNTAFLFTGDAERDTEQVILDAGYDLSATVLKVGHHGSDTSTTYPFLREIMPEYAVISVGNGNSYGHPIDHTLSRLRDAGVTVFRTDLQGDIYCTSNGEHVTFTTEYASDDNDSTTAGILNIPNPAPATPEIKHETETADPISEECAYILNTNTKKFHYPACKSVKQMKEKNKQEYTGIREEVIDMGYDPCGNCHP